MKPRKTSLLPIARGRGAERIVVVQGEIPHIGEESVNLCSFNCNGTRRNTALKTFIPPISQPRMSTNSSTFW